MESPSTCPQVCLEKPCPMRCGFLAVAGAAPLSSEHMDLHHLSPLSEQLIICCECYLNCPIWYFTPARCHLQEIRDTACASSVSSWPLALSIVLWSQTHLPQKMNGQCTAFLPAVKDPAVAERSFLSLSPFPRGRPSTECLSGLPALLPAWVIWPLHSPLAEKPVAGRDTELWHDFLRWSSQAVGQGSQFVASLWTSLLNSRWNINIPTWWPSCILPHFQYGNHTGSFYCWSLCLHQCTSHMSGEEQVLFMAPLLPLCKHSATTPLALPLGFPASAPESLSGKASQSSLRVANPS